MSPVLDCWTIQTFIVSSWWQQSVTCFYHYSISEYRSVLHCSLYFEAPRLGCGFLSIILVLENCKFRSLKVLEFCAFSMLWTLHCVSTKSISLRVWHCNNAVSTCQTWTVKRKHDLSQQRKQQQQQQHLAVSNRPIYLHLLKVKPGPKRTSLGLQQQVSYQPDAISDANQQHHSSEQFA